MAAQAGLSLTWSETPETGFLVRLKYELFLLSCRFLHNVTLRQKFSSFPKLFPFRVGLLVFEKKKKKLQRANILDLFCAEHVKWKAHEILEQVSSGEQIPPAGNIT